MQQIVKLHVIKIFSVCANFCFRASKIPVCEVDNRSCSGTPERYQKSYRSSDEDESLQSDLDSVSSSSFVSSTYSGELSDVSDSLSSISDEDFPQTSSKKGYRGNKESKTLSSQLKICSPIGKSRGIDNYKIPKRSRNDKRKRSSDREISPRKSSPKRDNKSRTANNRPDDSLERRSVFRRTASRFDDNVKLEDSLQRFRERKGMTPYSSSSSMSPVKRNSFDSRLNSSQPSNVDSLSRESSIISSTEAQTSKDVEKSEDKHPLAADDVSPMDRMRIEQYLIGCKQKYTFNSCGSTPFVDSHCHIDFLFKKTEFKGTLTKFQELVPFPENYGVKNTFQRLNVSMLASMLIQFVFRAVWLCFASRILLASFQCLKKFLPRINWLHASVVTLTVLTCMTITWRGILSK